MSTTIRAIYEGGVLKPLEPLDLSEREVVEIRIAKRAGKSLIIADLDGIWAGYLAGGSLSYEEIDEMTEGEHGRSVDRMLRQVDGDFGKESDPDA